MCTCVPLGMYDLYICVTLPCLRCAFGSVYWPQRATRLPEVGVRVCVMVERCVSWYVCVYKRERWLHKRVRAFTLSPICAKTFVHTHPTPFLLPPPALCPQSLGVWQLEEEGGGTAGPGRQPRQQKGSESGPEHSQGRSTWKPLVCFHGPAWIPVAWGPCQLWEQWCSPCLRRHPHPQLKGIDRRVRGQGVEAGGLHACVSVSACEPKIKEQP